MLYESFQTSTQVLHVQIQLNLSRIFPFLIKHVLLINFLKIPFVNLKFDRIILISYYIQIEKLTSNVYDDKAMISSKYIRMFLLKGNRCMQFYF